MAPCPKCGESGGINGFKKHGWWQTKCYRCGYVLDIECPSRKISRYIWNRNYENVTGETLEDEMCGRMPNSFMKKEVRAGIRDYVDTMGASGTAWKDCFEDRPRHAHKMWKKKPKRTKGAKTNE